ncbi:MAG: protein disulfide oxidoreductase [Pseudoxanthomonas suwonensis]|nr:protein disulfide oxidoreductase [Pseudoxanthomonas suwonensis]
MSTAHPRSRRWPARLRSLAINLLLLLAFIVALDWFRAPDASAIAETTLTTTNGQTVNFQVDPRPTVLYFWGDWCLYCRHTSPAIERLQRNGHRVVSVAMQSGDDARVHAYLQRHGWDFPVVNDPDGAISQAFDVGTTPTIAIVSNGRMRMATSGWTSYWGLRARLWLARLA